MRERVWVLFYLEIMAYFDADMQIQKKGDK